MRRTIFARGLLRNVFHFSAPPGVTGNLRLCEVGELLSVLHTCHVLRTFWHFRGHVQRGFTTRVRFTRTGFNDDCSACVSGFET